MSNKKQTAVEQVAVATRQWQIDWSNYEERGKDKPQPFEEFIKPFLELEKEQIEDAFCDGVDDEYEHHINDKIRKNSEEYYNETFKKL